MKKISILVVFIFSFIFSFGQSTLPFPLIQSTGNDSTLLNIHNAYTNGMVFKGYADTSAANATHFGFYNFSLLATNDGVFHIRYNGAWIPVVTGIGTIQGLDSVLHHGNQSAIKIKIFGTLTSSQTTIDTARITVGTWSYITGTAVSTNNVDIGNVSNPALLNLDNGSFDVTSIRADSTTGNRLHQMPDSPGVFGVSVNGNKFDKYGNITIATGTGTVTNVSGVNTNGFTWSIANPTTTPALTLTLQNATTSQSGQLTSTDWNTFNNKQALITPSNTAKQYWNGYKNFVGLNTDSSVEGSTNLFFTNARARTAISLTTTGSSGVSTYNNSTGVFNIPNYAGGGSLPAFGYNVDTTGSKLNATDTQWVVPTGLVYNSSAAAAANTAIIQKAHDTAAVYGKGVFLAITQLDTVYINQLTWTTDVPLKGYGFNISTLKEATPFTSMIFISGGSGLVYRWRVSDLAFYGGNLGGIGWEFHGVSNTMFGSGSTGDAPMIYGFDTCVDMVDGLIDVFNHLYIGQCKTGLVFKNDLSITNENTVENCVVNHCSKLAFDYSGGSGYWFYNNDVGGNGTLGDSTSGCWWFHGISDIGVANGQGPGVFGGHCEGNTGGFIVKIDSTTAAVSSSFENVTLEGNEPVKHEFWVIGHKIAPFILNRLTITKQIVGWGDANDTDLIVVQNKGAVVDFDKGLLQGTVQQWNGGQIYMWDSTLNAPTQFALSSGAVQDTFKTWNPYTNTYTSWFNITNPSNGLWATSGLNANVSPTFGTSGNYGIPIYTNNTQTGVFDNTGHFMYGNAATTPVYGAPTISAVGTGTTYIGSQTTSTSSTCGYLLEEPSSEAQFLHKGIDAGGNFGSTSIPNSGLTYISAEGNNFYATAAHSIFGNGNSGDTYVDISSFGESITKGSSTPRSTGSSDLAFVVSGAAAQFDSIRNTLFTSTAMGVNSVGTFVPIVSTLAGRSDTLKAQSGAVSSISTVTPVSGLYSIGGDINVTAVSLDVIQVQVSYKDENGNAQTLNLGNAISATGFNSIPTTTIWVQAGTNIVTKTTLTTGTGSIAYDIATYIEQKK